MLPKIFWNSLLVTPAILSAALMTSAATAADLQSSVEPAEPSVSQLSLAAETPVAAETAASVETVDPAAVAPVESPVQLAAAPAPALEAPADQEAQVSVAQPMPQPMPQPTAEVAQVPVAQPVSQATPAGEDSLQQIMQYSREGNRVQSQVTSISQLSDVQPTDWAFQALQSLVERYGCIAGYPDGTYRGSRAMTRYEFAAGMNACLDRVNELIAAGLADAVTREDLATLQRLQEEFAAELATVRGQVDGLEARTAELEANQFSTTTRLVGRTVFSLADAFGGDGFINDGGGNTVFQSRVRLNFDTSFFGTDRLRARLQWGNVGGGNDFSTTPIDGVSTLFRPQTQFNYTGNTNGNVVLNRLEYRFTISAATIYIEAQGGELNDILPTLSPFADREQGSISRFGSYSPIYDLIPGSSIGAGISYNFGNNFELAGGYLSGEGADPSSDSGLFNGDYVAFGQLTFGRGSGPLTLGLTYSNSYRNQLIVNAYGVEGQFKINPQIAIGGWASYYDSDSVDSGGGDSNFWTYAGTLAISDLGIEGSLLGFVVGVPPRLTEFSVSGTRAGTATQDAALHVEGFYRFPVNDNISITPGVIWVLDPGNNNDNDDFVIGAVRTSFSF